MKTDFDVYIRIILGLTVLICAGWVALVVIKFFKKQTARAYMCLVYAASYGLLVWRNFRMNPHKLDYFTVNISYTVYMLQLAAVICFIKISLDYK